MGITKTDAYHENQLRISELLKALAHPARIAIMEYLIGKGDCICGDIVDELPLAQPTVSRHLKELKSAGLIKGNIDGRSICYCADEERLNEVMTYFQKMAEQLRVHKKSCC